jgi:hypothetical protein
LDSFHIVEQVFLGIGGQKTLWILDFLKNWHQKKDIFWPFSGTFFEFDIDMRNGYTEIQT